MYWVYILKCEDDHYYIGQTKKLFSRFYQHRGGNGSINTSLYPIIGIMSIYKVNIIHDFIQYDHGLDQILKGDYDYSTYPLKNFGKQPEEGFHLEAETAVVECLMLNYPKKWKKFRGGKYTRFDVEYKYPTSNYNKIIPLCKCGLPCDIRKNENKNYLFFRCAKKNIWPALENEFNAGNPCKFYQEYTKDKKFRDAKIERWKNRKKILSELFKKSPWLRNVETDRNKCMLCNSTSKKLISYAYIKRALCFNCFIDKNDELSKKYTNCKKSREFTPEEDDEYDNF